MDRLTAYRTFANPGYSPARGRVRIRNDRWYRVRLQKVETDPRCDYVGLADGEEVLILPGRKAREERDRRLNRCNAIEEWRGEVWKVECDLYGHINARTITWHASEAEARAQGWKYREQQVAELENIRQWEERYRARGALEQAQECRAAARREEDPWRLIIERVR